MKADEFNGAAAALGMSARDRLGPDVKALAQGANAVLNDFTEAAGAGIDDARSRITHTASRARESSENLIHRHPWRAVALMAGAGLVLGWLLKRR